MIDVEIRRVILALHESGESDRAVARRLGINRKTIKKVIDGLEAVASQGRTDRKEIDENLLRQLYKQCQGWMKRMHEILIEDLGFEIGYSTLTLRCRELGMEDSKRDLRHVHVEMGPGEEMQHDTSPYTIKLGDAKVKVVASIVYLRYSKMHYLKFYLHFCRYDMKCFLHEALIHFGGSAKTCIIDNTNLARLRGRGYSALIHPEMISFSHRYGFDFICHEIQHSDRKAGNERAFHTTETNFLPGRTFRNMKDLNAQALEWATVRSPKRPNSKTKLMPAESFETEKKFLVPFAPDLPGPTRQHIRVIDPYGYVELATNFYWVPGNGRGPVDMVEHPGHLELQRSAQVLIRYDKPEQDVRLQRFTPSGVDTRPKRRQRTPSMEEGQLQAYGSPVAEYVEFLLHEARGVRADNLIRLAYGLSRKIDREIFVQTIQRAHQYRIADHEILENIASMFLGLPGRIPHDPEVDPDLERRSSYLEGELSPAPDLSVHHEDQSVHDEDLSVNKKASSTQEQDNPKEEEPC